MLKSNSPVTFPNDSGDKKITHENFSVLGILPFELLMF